MRLDVRPTRFTKVNNKLPTTEGVKQFKCQLFKNKKGGTHLFRTETSELLIKREVVFFLSFLLFFGAGVAQSV
jgi:hypothetical protein